MLQVKDYAGFGVGFNLAWITLFLTTREILKNFSRRLVEDFGMMRDQSCIGLIMHVMLHMRRPFVIHQSERSARNSNNRSRQFMVHKSGRTSFAQRAVTLRNEIQRSPTRAEVFKKCYKGQKGYANAATEEVTERLVAMASHNPENEDAIFREVLGSERKGRKRGMGRGITMRENNAFLRAQVEELTLQLAERDARDKERDVKDVETRQKLADLEARFEYLSQSLIPTPSSVPTPHQHLLSHVPYHSQWMNVPNQQRVQLPHCQRIYGPYHQQDLLNQQQLASHHTQRTKSFTDLLRDGSNMNSEVLMGCPDHMGEQH